MLSAPLAFLEFTCWNARPTSFSLVWNLWKSSSAADAPFKTTWIWLCFREKSEKSQQSKWLKNWFSSLASSAVFTEIFCVLPFTYLLINFIPLHTLLILLYVKWLSTFFYILPPPSEFLLSIPFVQTCWTEDMSIPLQFVSFYDGHEVFMWSDCLLNLSTDFLIGNMVFVSNT